MAMCNTSLKKEKLFDGALQILVLDLDEGNIFQLKIKFNSYKLCL